MFKFLHGNSGSDFGGMLVAHEREIRVQAGDSVSVKSLHRNLHVADDLRMYRILPRFLFQTEQGRPIYFRLVLLALSRSFGPTHVPPSHVVQVGHSQFSKVHFLLCFYYWQFAVGLRICSSLHRCRHLA